MFTHVVFPLQVRRSTSKSIKQEESPHTWLFSWANIKCSTFKYKNNLWEKEQNMSPFVIHCNTVSEFHFFSDTHELTMYTCMKSKLPLPPSHSVLCHFHSVGWYTCGSCCFASIWWMQLIMQIKMQFMLSAVTWGSILLRVAASGKPCTFVGYFRPVQHRAQRVWLFGSPNMGGEIWTHERMTSVWLPISPTIDLFVEFPFLQLNLTNQLNTNP